MRKLFVLLRKEIREIITLQVIIPLIIAAFAFMFIGNIVGKEAQKASFSEGNIAILDLDQSLFSQEMLKQLRLVGFSLEEYKDLSETETKKEVFNSGINNLIIIPQGFGTEILGGKQPKISIYNYMRNISMVGGGSGVAHSVYSFLNDYVSNFHLAVINPNLNPETIKKPIDAENYVIINEKEARAHPEEIKGFLSTQTMFIPIVLFMVIMVAAQMIVTSVAAEKENKTLETLLSTPIKRTSLVAAKMMAAGVMGLIAAVAYMFGFSRYMGGLTSSVMDGTASNSINTALSQLGLVLTTNSYVLLGLSVFMGLLCTLAIALIIGVFADNLKAAQSLITPLTFLVMVPYLLSMFLDITTVTPLLRYALYAIPFAHPFMAMPNLFLQNYSFVIGGVIYQALAFLILVMIAGRIYSTDRVMTMKLGKKKR